MMLSRPHKPFRYLIVLVLKDASPLSQRQVVPVYIVCHEEQLLMVNNLSDFAVICIALIQILLQ